MIFALCFLAVLFGFMLYVWYVYNKITRVCNTVNEAWSNVAVSLQKRHDAISQIMATVHASKEYEQLVQSSVAAIRRQDISGASGAEKELQHSVQVTIEAYPDVKNNTLFQDLVKQLVQLEDEIQGSRLLFNRSVALYRLQLRLFPSGLVATALGYAPIDFFELTPGE